MTTTATPVRFTQRPDHSLLLGLSATRAITLAACVLAVAAVTVAAGMTTGLITAIGISPVAGSALLMVEGRALIEWTPDAARYAWRGAQGRLRFLAPVDRPARAGILPIPGTALQLSVLEAADGAAILRDKTADTWTVIAAVTGHGFLYADPETQDAACAGLGRALAAIGGSGQITRIHITHRVRPETAETPDPAIDSASMPPSGDEYDDAAWPGSRPAMPAAGTPGSLPGGTAVDGTASSVSTQPATDIYRQTLTEHATSWRHDTLIALTVGGKAARAAIRRSGHGSAAAARVIAAHRAGLAETLAAADATVETWLTQADLTDWIRDGYDPASIPVTRKLNSARRADSTQATPAAGDSVSDGSPAGPVAVAGFWSQVRTDSAFHQVLWVSDWPRFDTHPAFLAPLLLPAGATVTTALIYEPIPTPVALRQIGRDKVAQTSDAALRRRIGTLDTAEQAARAADTAEREAELAEGHLDMRHTALIAITAATREDLADAATRIRQAAAAAGCDTRILYGQQLAALNAVILPSGCRL
jgi:hypothetical protein